MNDWLDWQVSIVRDIHHPDLPERRVWKYTMPRNIGVTHFLTDYANELTYAKKSVVFIVRNSSNLWLIREKVEPYGVEIIQANGSTLNQIRGRKFDWIIIDNVPDNFVEISTLLSYTKQILWINTVEGQ